MSLREFTGHRQTKKWLASMVDNSCLFTVLTIASLRGAWGKQHMIKHQTRIGCFKSSCWCCVCGGSFNVRSPSCTSSNLVSFSVVICYRRCSLSDTLSVRHSRFVSSALKLWIWAFQDFPAFFWFPSRGSLWQVLCRYFNAIFPLFNLAQHTSCAL